MKIEISLSHHVLMIDCTFDVEDGDIHIDAIYLLWSCGWGKKRRVNLTGKVLELAIVKARKRYLQMLKEY